MALALHWASCCSLGLSQDPRMVDSSHVNQMAASLEVQVKSRDDGVGVGI
jgi:hypothetical protein